MTKLKKVDKRDVVMSNAIIEGDFHPGNINQYRLLLAALLDVKAMDKIKPSDVFTVHANDIMDLFAVNKRAAYDGLHKSARQLTERYLTVYSKPNGARGEPDSTYINFVDRAKCIPRGGRVEMTFTPSIIPYLSGITRKFTKFKLENMRGMKSIYGMRFYMICLKWILESAEPCEILKEIKIDDFRRLFGFMDGTPAKHKYKRLDTLKEKVIQPAINDINKCSNIRVTPGQRKAGRNVVALQFTIKTKTAIAREGAMKKIRAMASEGRAKDKARGLTPPNTPKVGNNGDVAVVTPPPGEQQELPYKATKTTKKVEKVVDKLSDEAAAEEKLIAAARANWEAAEAKANGGKGAPATTTKKKTGKKAAATNKTTKKTPAAKKVAKKRQKK